ncbi:MAG: phosphopyruvate hydratase [Candidatus Aenigmatarchaeota archaeon]
MSAIKDIKAREILDSRGDPTVETEVITEESCGKAAVPSGASTGENEALELRDGGRRYGGKGVQKAVSVVENEIKEELEGADCQNPEELDERMIDLDGTEDKSTLGANAILSVSLAAARAAADEKDKELYKLLHEKFSSGGKMEIPRPFLNVINGGEHAGNDLAVQEFMIVPLFEDFSKNIQATAEIYHGLEGILESRYGKEAVNVGDEGGFAPSLTKTEDALDLLIEATEVAGYRPGKDVKLAMDAAASQFYEDGDYAIDNRVMNQEQLEDFWLELIENYPILSIEDPFDEEDFEAFASLNEGTEARVVGDDLLVTNPGRIEKAIEKEACDTLLLKVNQIGTLTEAMEAAKLAKSNDWKVIVSHRSGETTDPFISDLAVALGAYGIKAGAPARGERTAKYNRLLRVEEEL